MMNQTTTCSQQSGNTSYHQAFSGSSQSLLMDIINQASFAMDDILLYLDTHPCDQAALDYYRRVASARMNAMNAYQANYGPLMVDQVHNGNDWTWMKGKWPWEGGRQTCGDMKKDCSTR